jgi:hypothetical protein
MEDRKTKTVLKVNALLRTLESRPRYPGLRSALMADSVPT